MKYFFILLFATILTPCLAQKFRPALRLSKDSTYYLVSTGTSAIAQSVNGRENKVTLSMSYKIAFKVTGVTDTVYNMDVSYSQLEMKIQMADTAIDMDSRKASPFDVPSSIMAAMMNKTFNIALTKSGKIKSVANIDKMINEVFDGFPQIDPAKKEQIKKQFLQSFGPDAFKGTLEMGTAVFPDKPVTKDDKWTINTTVESPAKATLQTVYQLIDATNNYYQIHGDGTMVSDKNAKPLEINGLPMKYDLGGTTLTDIKVNKKTGWIMQVGLKQLMSGNIEILDSPNSPGGMTIPMTFNTDVVTTGN